MTITELMQRFPTEDAACMGGKRKNMPKARRAAPEGCGAVGKVAVAGAKDRTTKRVGAAVVQATDGETLQGFVRARAKAGATIHTDDAAACRGMAGFEHEAVEHPVGEHVRGMAHPNGIGSFRAMPKHARIGVHHEIGPKPLERHVGDFAGRQASAGWTRSGERRTLRAAVGGRPTCAALVADDGLASGAQSWKRNAPQGRRPERGEAESIFDPFRSTSCWNTRNAQPGRSTVPVMMFLPVEGRAASTGHGNASAWRFMAVPRELFP